MRISTMLAVAVCVPLALLAACQQDMTGRLAANQAALNAGYPFETHRRCDGEVARQLQEAGIAPASVDAIWYTDQSSIDLDLVVGFNAYVRLKERPGLLVVDVEDEACLTRQVYTRDGLELPGIPAF
jgi:hypothetical protein